MSEKFGHLFTEAREKKGLSLESIADSIRIRAEYLEAIENETFNFNLPDIYKRGFYKSYAEYLGLDVNEMMKLCPIPAFEIQTASTIHPKELLADAARRAQEANLKSVSVDVSDIIDDTPKTIPTHRVDRDTVLKILGIVVLAGLLLWGCIALISRITTHHEEIEETPVAQEIIQKRVTLRATGDLRLMVRDEDTREALFTGILHQGENKIITYQKPLLIYFDHGEFLDIEWMDGDHLHPESGRGGIRTK